MKNEKGIVSKIDLYVAEHTQYDLSESISTTMLFFYTNGICMRALETSFSNTENAIVEFMSKLKNKSYTLDIHSLSDLGQNLDLNVNKRDTELWGSFEYKGKKYSCFVISCGYKETYFSQTEINKLISRIEDKLK